MNFQSAHFLNYLHTTFTPSLINLSKLKHGNNAEITKTCFPINYQTGKYLFQKFKYLFTIGVSHILALLSLLLLKFEKCFWKEWEIYISYITYFFSYISCFLKLLHEFQNCFFTHTHIHTNSGFSSGILLPISHLFFRIFFLIKRT